MKNRKIRAQCQAAFRGRCRLKAAFRAAFLGAMLGLAFPTAQAQLPMTTVSFPLKELTGQDYTRTLTLTPLDGTLLYQNISYNSGPITLLTSPKGATNSLGQVVSGGTTNLLSGNYRITYSGLSLSSYLFVPVALYTNWISASDPLWIRKGITELFVVTQTNGVTGGTAGGILYRAGALDGVLLYR